MGMFGMSDQNETRLIAAISTAIITVAVTYKSNQTQTFVEQKAKENAVVTAAAVTGQDAEDVTPEVERAQADVDEAQAEAAQ